MAKIFDLSFKLKRFFDKNIINLLYYYLQFTFTEDKADHSFKKWYLL